MVYPRNAEGSSSEMSRTNGLTLRAIIALSVLALLPAQTLAERGPLTHYPDVHWSGYSLNTLAATRNGSHLYVGMRDGIFGFSRDRRTGSVSEIASLGGCASPYGPSLSCLLIKSEDFESSSWFDVRQILIPRDGRHLYTLIDVDREQQV